MSLTFEDLAFEDRTFEDRAFEDHVLAVAATLRRRPYFVWLDASVVETEDGRFSYMACDPVEVLSASSFRVTAQMHIGGRKPFWHWWRVDHGGMTRALGLVCDAPTLRVPEWMGYVSYEACLDAMQGRKDAPVPRSAPWFPAAAGARFARFGAVWVIDHRAKSMHLAATDASMAEALWKKSGTPVGQGEEARSVHPLRSAEAGPFAGSSTPSGVAAATSVPAALPLDVSDMVASDALQHRRAIEEALRWMAEGSLYEVNLARHWKGCVRGDVFALWQGMRGASPVPFGAYIGMPDAVVLSSSMELFLDWQGPGGSLRTAPIKGTRPFSPATDDLQTLADALRHDPKEHAEHVMVVDLLRNDVGRIAVPGSVHVETCMDVHGFAGLAHMISQITCSTSQDLTLPSLLEATLPPGSITGTPKQRAVQAIATLESVQRGVYTGCIGFVDTQGGAKLSVAIRSACCLPRGARSGTSDASMQEAWDLYYFAGGGIVAGSNPDAEVVETELKASRFLQACGFAGSSPLS